ncbi:MAG: hypothetical protein R2791_14800 [Saprospiraceae bacterium]
MPDEEWLGEKHLVGTGNQHNRVPSARMLVCYDLLNQLVTALQFHTRNTAEVVVAQRSISQIPPDMVYDRAFASHIIPFLHQHFGSNCIVRLPTEQHTVKAFVLSGKNQLIVNEPLQIKARRALSRWILAWMQTRPSLTV